MALLFGDILFRFRNLIQGYQTFHKLLFISSMAVGCMFLLRFLCIHRRCLLPVALLLSLGYSFFHFENLLYKCLRSHERVTFGQNSFHFEDYLTFLKKIVFSDYLIFLNLSERILYQYTMIEDLRFGC